MVKSNGQTYLRGQVWWSGNNSDTGANKSRPFVIVSNNAGNKFAPFVLAVPCTTEEKTNLATHVKLYFNNYNNTVLCEQIRTIYTSDLTGYICTLDGEAMNQIDEALKVSLGLLDSNSNLIVDDFTVVLNNANTEKVIEPKQELPKIKATIKGDHSKFHRWTLEEKQEYVQYYTRYGKEKKKYSFLI